MNDKILGMLIGLPLVIMMFFSFVEPSLFIGVLFYMVFLVIILKITGILDIPIVEPNQTRLHNFSSVGGKN